MRRFLLTLSLLAIVSTVRAGDLLGPADYLKIMTSSKVHYTMTAAPAKTPVVPLECRRRDTSERVVIDGTARKLVEWKVTPEAQKLLVEAEELYGADKYSEAGEKYKAAFAADPEAVAAYLYYGDTLLIGAKDPTAALEQYKKAIALDSTLPTGHLFAATAYIQLGRPNDAREQIVQALTYYPGYEAVWKIADRAPELWNNKPIVRHRFEPTAGYLGATRPDGVEIYSGANFEWAGYAICKAAWANEPKFANAHPREGWSLEEERACVFNQLTASYNTTESKLEKEQKSNGVKKPKVTDEEIIAALDPLTRHLFDVANAHLLDGYILFEVIGQHCPILLGLLEDDGKKQLQDYIRSYVVVAAQ